MRVQRLVEHFLEERRALGDQAVHVHLGDDQVSAARRRASLIGDGAAAAMDDPSEGRHHSGVGRVQRRLTDIHQHIDPVAVAQGQHLFGEIESLRIEYLGDPEPRRELGVLPVGVRHARARHPYLGSQGPRDRDGSPSQDRLGTLDQHDLSGTEMSDARQLVVGRHQRGDRDTPAGEPQSGRDPKHPVARHAGMGTHPDRCEGQDRVAGLEIMDTLPHPRHHAHGLTSQHRGTGIVGTRA